jgi:hypothetical protein
MALDIWQEKRDTRNMALDTRGYVISPMFTADPGHKGTAYVAGHGKVLRGANLRQIQVHDTSVSALHHETIASNEMDDIFATPPLLSGDPLGGEGGATGAAIQEANAGINLKGYVKAKVLTGLTPFLNKWNSLNQQLLDDVVPLSVLGPKGLEWRYITPDQIRGDFEFLHTATKRNQNKAILGAQFVGITTQFLNLQMAGLLQVNWDRLAKDYLELVVGIDHPELYINPMAPQGPVPMTADVIEMLVLGHKLAVDPRMDLIAHFREMTYFVAQVVPQIEDPLVRKNIGDYYMELRGVIMQMMAARAQALAERRLLLMGVAQKEGAKKEKAEEKAAKSADGKGGSSNAKRGPEQRDGRGGTAGRRMMVAMAGGPQGQGRGA